MEAWTLDTIRAALAEFAGAPDEDDERERVRQRLLDVATDHFVRYGYRRANVGDIARDTGIGKGTVYRYFKSKKDLIVACGAREKLALLPALATVYELPEPERLEAYLAVALRFIFEAPLSSALVRRDRELELLWEDMGREEVEVGRARGVAFLETFIAGAAPGLTDAERHTLAQVLMTVVQLMAHLPEERLGVSVDTFVETFAGVLSRGVAAAKGPPTETGDAR